MHILIPILGFAPQGGYRVLSQLANTWIRMGHDCTFLIPATSADPYFPTNAHILRFDRKGHRSDRPSDARASGMDNILSLAMGLRRVANDYDIILANHSLTAFPVRFFGGKKAKKLYYIQAYEPEYYKITETPVKHVLARLSYFLNMNQIANSDQYQGAGIRPVDVVRPGIDLSTFTFKENTNEPRPKSTITLGTIGRTEPYKGTQTAIEAYRILRRSNEHLWLNVGFGNVEPADDISITQIKSDVELAAYYRSIDVLIVSCKGQHGAPHYPLIEAMASGTPVVHTDYYPGTDENSWPADGVDAPSIANRLQALLNTPQEIRDAKIKAARRLIENELSWDAVAKKFENHFYD